MYDDQLDAPEQQIFETDIAPTVWDETDPYDTMTLYEWVDEFNANACCSSSHEAARNMCGCGGSAELPYGVSRVIKQYFEDAEQSWADNRAEELYRLDYAG